MGKFIVAFTPEFVEKTITPEMLQVGFQAVGFIAKSALRWNAEQQRFDMDVEFNPVFDIVLDENSPDRVMKFTSISDDGPPVVVVEDD